MAKPKQRAKAAAGAKGGRVRSPAKAAAVRKNGKKGGRPRRKLFLEDFEELGPPPVKPLELARWLQRAIAIDIYRQVMGRADQDLSRSLRASAAAASKLVPLDVMYEAQRMITGDAQELDADEGPAPEPIEGAPPISAPARRRRKD